MSTFSRRLLLPAVVGLAIGLWAGAPASVAGQSPATASADLILGTWHLDIAKSKYSPGRGPKSETRTYEAVREGVKVTITRIEADGRSTLIQYTAAYDRVEYPVSGSREVDTIALEKGNAYTAEATLRHGGKEIGRARREVSKAGTTLTIGYQGIDSRGSFNNVAVYEKETQQG